MSDVRKWGRDDLAAFHVGLCERGRRLLLRKSADYAGSEWTRNFDMAEHLGVPPPLGVLVRAGDKLSRLATLATNEARVKDESVVDTAIDLINYTVIATALILGATNDKKGERTGRGNQSGVDWGRVIEVAANG